MKPDWVTNRITDCSRCHGVGTISITKEATLMCDCDATPERMRGGKYAGTSHPQIILRSHGRIAHVDLYMADLITALWAADIETWVSCQGDTGGQGYVGVRWDQKERAVSTVFKFTPITEVIDRLYSPVWDVLIHFPPIFVEVI